MTLLLVCMLLAGWVRSLETFDECELRIGSTIYSLRSAHGGAALATDEGRPPRTWTSMEIPAPCPQIDPNFPEVPKHGLEALGFYFGGDPDRDSLFHIPYWSLVVPLTLISIYLVISKPRRTNKLSESAQVEGP